MFQTPWRVFLPASGGTGLSFPQQQRLHTLWQKKAFAKLLGLRYKIVYHKGKENAAADALSRKEHELVLAISSVSKCQPAWLEEVVLGYQQDPTMKKLLSQLAVTKEQHPDYELADGVVKYKGRIWIGNNLPLQQKLFSAFHSSSLGGHSGSTGRIKGLFAWPGMKKQLKGWVRYYEICQQAKLERIKMPGLLEPLRVPRKPWQHIAMDFIEGLPQSGPFNCLLVVVDRFSKYAHFIPLAHPYTASKVASLFVDHVYRLHSLPETITSDPDPVFTSKFWKDLFQAIGTELKLSTAYHPATDGQTERVNQCVETYLRCFVHACPKKWSNWIALAEYWYNTSHHATVNSSPFVVLYGHEPRHWGLTAPGTEVISNVQTWITEQRVVHDLLRVHLLRAQQLMKKYADQNRTFREFAIGDMVFLKLQPYIQASVAPRANHKLLFQFFGPFRVLQRVSDTSYKIALPEGSTVHPVFHVSLLRQALKQGTPVSSSLPHMTDALAVPHKVLATRLRKKANQTVTQDLIQWSNGGPDAATWEDREELRNRFLEAPAWGQAVAKGGGGVRVPPGDVPGAKRSAGVADTDDTIGPRPARSKKPNSRYFGPMWLGST